MPPPRRLISTLPSPRPACFPWTRRGPLWSTRSGPPTSSSRWPPTTRETKLNLTYVMVIGILAVLGGATLSFYGDLPTGASIVCVFGLCLGLQILLEALRGRR